MNIEDMLKFKVEKSSKQIELEQEIDVCENALSNAISRYREDNENTEAQSDVLFWQGYLRSDVRQLKRHNIWLKITKVFRQGDK